MRGFLLIILLYCELKKTLTQDQETYEVVHPIISTSHPQSSPSRQKRDTKNTLYISINSKKEDFLLELTQNKRLLSPGTIIEWVLEGGKKVYKNLPENCYYYGRNKKSPGYSVVAVSNCDGIVGYIQSNERSYFIEPINGNFDSKGANISGYLVESLKDTHTKENAGPHIIYRVKPLSTSNLHVDEELPDDIARNKRSPSIYSKGGKASFIHRQPNGINERVPDFSIVEATYLKLNNDHELLKPSKRKPRQSKRSKEKKDKRGIKKSKKERRKHRKKIRQEREKKRKEKERKRREREKRKQQRERRRRKRKQRKQREKNKKKRIKAEKAKSNNSEANVKSEVPSIEDAPTLEEEGYSPDHVWDTVYGAVKAYQYLKTIPLSNSSDEDPEKWLEIAVGVDYTVINFHGDQNVEKYVLTLFNIVSAIYEDPSINANIHIVLLRLIFYKDKKQSQVREGLAKKSLETVNRWSHRLYIASPPNLQHDIAVWLTKKDLGGPSGYAPVGGICKPDRSCTLNRDEGLTSAFIIAHEMGHVLGLSHDGDSEAGNNCVSEEKVGSVMAPLVSATFDRFHWSSCSRSEYRRLAQLWACLENEPKWKNASLFSSKIKYTFTLEDQCRMEFGEGFGLCGRPYMTDPCTYLWCSNSSTPHMCKTKKGPPLEGTPCGYKRWCRNGFCQSISKHKLDIYNPSIYGSDNEVIPVKHNPQNGGWSVWSEWGHCSRTCGIGVSFRTRDCNSPRPQFGGLPCKGKQEEWKTCSANPCPESTDFRAAQCNLLKYLVKLSRRRGKMSWLPYEHPKRNKKCKLTCQSVETNEIYISKEDFLDGTRCSYDSMDDICVQGKCIPVGCDGNVLSMKKTDRCGVCGGDNSTCIQSSFKYENMLKQDIAVLASIPKGASNIIVKETSPSLNYFSIKDNSSRIVLNARGNQDPVKFIITEGALFHYHEVYGKEILSARGPLINPITIMVKRMDNVEASVKISYYRSNTANYKWSLGPYSDCTSSCGGGTERRQLFCIDELTGSQVETSQCKYLVKPTVISRQCNTFKCDFRWQAGNWEHCTTTCGTHGVQNRVVSCIRGDESCSNCSDAFVDPRLCHNLSKPDEIQPCNRKQCPDIWEPAGWSPCSVTCGIGEQRHEFKCNKENEEECGPKPTIMRVCEKKCEECIDASPFCSVESLSKYCFVDKYSEMCCQSCLEFRDNIFT